MHAKVQRDISNCHVGQICYNQAGGPVEQLLALMYNSVIYNNLSVCTTQLNSAGLVHSDHFIVPPEDL